MDTKKLYDYLKNGSVNGVDGEASDAALVIDVEGMSKDAFFELLANLCAVEMLAKDFHYRAKGKAFYGEHLLADLIRDMGEKSDDINEIRYMGELQMNPPFRADVAQRAVVIIGGMPQTADENGLIEALCERVNALASLVESAKAGNPASGTTAVLDSISEKALQSSGFLKRMMTGADMAHPTDSDVIM